MSTHRLLTGTQLHEPYHYVQESDPGSVGSNLYWLQVSTGNVKRRNSANSAWDSISSGVTTFTGLSDTPASYSGQGLKTVRVNTAANALEFYTPTLGATVFTGLSDVPSSYSGQGLKAVRVNTSATALEFFTVAGGVTTFTGLSDVPSSYAGQGLKGVRVNTGATALEFYTPNTIAPAFIALTDGATITITCDVTKTVQNAKVTLGGNRTLAISGAVDGMTGVLIVTQDGTGTRTLALPATSKVTGGGAGTVTLTTTAGAKDVLAWTYDGSNYFWTKGLNFT